MAKVTFNAIEKDGCRDGTYGWEVYVDGKQIVDRVKSENMDISNRQFDKVWEAAGIDVEFNYDEYIEPAVDYINIISTTNLLK